jgi:hypothetical protein
VIGHCHAQVQFERIDHLKGFLALASLRPIELIKVLLNVFRFSVSIRFLGGTWPPGNVHKVAKRNRVGSSSAPLFWPPFA